MKGAIQKINNNLLKLLDEFGNFFEIAKFRYDPENTTIANKT